MAVDGATLRYVVYDILRDFKQAYSEADISEFQLTYWVLVHADRMRKQHIQKIDSGEYISIFEVLVDTDGNGRKSIELPGRIYDFDLDKGIAFITYEQDGGLPEFTTVTFNRTTPAAAKRLYFRTEETPDEDNPYFYRVNDDLFFLGVESVTMTSVEVGLYTTLNPADTSLDLDQPFDFPQDLIPTLKRQIIDMGMFVMNVPKDLISDGVDSRGETPTRKMISVNDMNQQQP